MTRRAKTYLSFFLPILIIGILLVLPQSAFADSSESCSFEELQKDYMSDDSCWYCQITLIMTNSYLFAASKIMPVVQTLSRQILKYGFMVWLALFILKQVSSLAPITPGKMLQEIAVMVFKVWLAYAIVENALPFISEFVFTPIISTAVDIGNSMLSGIAAEYLDRPPMQLKQSILLLPFSHEIMPV